MSVAKEKILKSFYLLCALFGVLAVGIIFIFLLIKGIPGIAEIGFFKFLFGTKWQPVSGQYGILPLLTSTLAVTGLAILIGGGIGVLSAIFLARFCNKRFYKTLRNAINVLAGIPSVIFGFFGMQVVQKFFGIFTANGLGAGMLATGVVLSIMILPTVISVSLNSLNNVPDSYYEGAVALGATHSGAVFKTVLPAAKNGIIGAVILGLGRAVGETMAVQMVCGGVPNFPSLDKSILTITAAIVKDMGYAEGLAYDALISLGLVLLVFVLIITMFMHLSVSRKVKDRKFTFRLRLPQKDKTKNLNTKYSFYKFLSLLSMTLTIASLFGVVGFILIKGIPHLNSTLIFSIPQSYEDISMLPALLNTLVIVAVTVVIAMPIGVFAAIYLAEYTKKGSKLVKLIRSAIEILTSIPSIIFGLFGNLLFVKFFGWGFSLIGGCLTVVLMILPLIIRTTEQALLEVDDSYREGSLALGASKTRTIFKVVLPTAISGIVTGLILSIGRIIGESAVFIYTVGTAELAMPTSMGNQGITLSVLMYMWAKEGLHINEAYAVAVILLLVSLFINIAANNAERIFKKRRMT